MSTPMNTLARIDDLHISFGGVAALLAMLNSCATGVGVVNIDNGFGAACLASMINRRRR